MAKHDNPETNPVVLDLPIGVWDSILATASAFMAEGINVFDPKEGHNFIVERSGSGLNTEYKVTPSPRGSAIDPSVMDKLKDLAEWARQESEADKAKAVTSVRVITGNMESIAASSPRLAAPKTATNRLANVSADDVMDADFTEVNTSPKASADDELDDFLKDL